MKRTQYKVFVHCRTAGCGKFYGAYPVETEAEQKTVYSGHCYGCALSQLRFMAQSEQLLAAGIRLISTPNGLAGPEGMIGTVS